MKQSSNHSGFIKVINKKYEWKSKRLTWIDLIGGWEDDIKQIYLWENIIFTKKKYEKVTEIDPDLAFKEDFI